MYKTIVLENLISINNVVHIFLYEIITTRYQSIIHKKNCG